MNWGKLKRPNGSGEKSFEEHLQDFFEKPGMFFVVLLAIIIGTGIFTSYYIVRAQEKGVVTRFGRYLKTSSEGLHFKLPFGVDQVILVPTKIQEEAFGFSPTTRPSSAVEEFRFANMRQAGGNNPFTRSSSNAQTTALNPSESLMLTGDLNVAAVEWVVQYRVVNPRDFLFNVADPIKNIRDLTQTTMRKVVGDRSINDILTTGRGEIQSAVQQDMQKIIDETYKMGITIEDVILQDVAPPEPVQPSFNQVNSALQEQKQEINKAFESQNKVIPEAKGKANREISQARGYSEAIVNQAIGDAARFTQVFKEYTKAPEVTRRRIYLELIEELLMKVRDFTVVDPSIKGVLPVFSGGGASGSAGSIVSNTSGSSEARASAAPSALAAEESRTRNE